MSGSPEYKKQWYLANKTRILEKMKALRSTEGYPEYQHQVWVRRKADPVRLQHKHRQAVSRSQKFKDQVYAVLGEICSNCGFTDRRALQIDHIHGSGRQHRIAVGWGNTAYYKSIAEDPLLKDKYQILCANCNWIKRHENKECDQPRKAVIDESE